MLKLNNTPSSRIKDHAFVAVPQLVRLELSSCMLGTLEPRALAGLDRSLEWLHLDNNRLVNVRASSVTPLTNLHGLELWGNPWNCSCALLPLRRWMLRQNIPFGISPMCDSPRRLAGKAWDKLELEEFACAPRIAAPAASATGVEGRNVTLSCEVGGEPEPQVHWLQRNRIIANMSAVSRKLYLLQADARTSNMTILSADVQDAGEYVCRAENKAGRVEARVTLAVLRRPPDEAVGQRAARAAPRAAPPDRPPAAHCRVRAGQAS
ncbi:Peroxidasin, partial [Gryllus bimaculatus]